MPKITQTAPTKEKLFDAAQSLMLQKGYVASTVEDICCGAGVTKGSFFHYFANKEDLGKQVIRRFSENMDCALKESMDQRAEDPLERLSSLLDVCVSFFEKPNSCGCLVGMCSLEMGSANEELRKVCARCFQAFTDEVSSLLEEAECYHALPEKIESASVTQFLLATIQGSMVIFKATQDKSVLRRNLAQFRAYVESLFNVSPK